MRECWSEICKLKGKSYNFIHVSITVWEMTTTNFVYAKILNFSIVDEFHWLLQLWKSFFFSTKIFSVLYCVAVLLCKRLNISFYNLITCYSFRSNPFDAKRKVKWKDPLGTVCKIWLIWYEQAQCISQAWRQQQNTAATQSILNHIFDSWQISATEFNGINQTWIELSAELKYLPWSKKKFYIYIQKALYGQHAYFYCHSYHFPFFCCRSSFYDNLS